MQLSHDPFALLFLGGDQALRELLAGQQRFSLGIAQRFFRQFPVMNVGQ